MRRLTGHSHLLYAMEVMARDPLSLSAMCTRLGLPPPHGQKHFLLLTMQEGFISESPRNHFAMSLLTLKAIYMASGKLPVPWSTKSFRKCACNLREESASRKNRGDSSMGSVAAPLPSAAHPVELDQQGQGQGSGLGLCRREVSSGLPSLHL